MEDRVTLDGILMKCNQNPSKVRNPLGLRERPHRDRAAGSLNGRSRSREAKRQAEFEKAREQLRLAQDKVRQEQEAKTKVDAYTLPVVPVDPAAAAQGRCPGRAGAGRSQRAAARGQRNALRSRESLGARERRSGGGQFIPTRADMTRAFACAISGLSDPAPSPVDLSSAA